MEREGATSPSRNGFFEGKVRFLASFGAAVAAVVAFAWASQARQDEAIRRNETAIAVIAARLDSICERLDELRAILLRERGLGGR